MQGLRTVALVVGLALSSAASAETPPGNPNYTPAPPKEGYSYPDCYCTDSEGRRVEMGKTACLRIGGREVLARCEMSVNNPTWRYQDGEGCPGA